MFNDNFYVWYSSFAVADDQHIQCTRFDVLADLGQPLTKQQAGNDDQSCVREEDLDRIRRLGDESGPSSMGDVAG